MIRLCVVFLELGGSENHITGKAPQSGFLLPPWVTAPRGRGGHCQVPEDTGDFFAEASGP